MDKTPQVRHEQVIAALDELYRWDDGQRRFKLRTEGLNSGTIHELDYNEINSFVVLFADLFNMTGGSVGDINLYRLLQAYLTMPECREKINEVVEAAHSEKYVASQA